MGAKAGWWLIVGGGMVAAGSFLPWVSAATIFGTISQNGMDGDGMITLGAGVVIALLGGLIVSGGNTSRLMSALLWIAIGLITLIWIVDFQDIRNRLELVDSPLSSGRVGYGMWVMAIGALVSVIGTANISPGQMGARHDATD